MPPILHGVIREGRWPFSATGSGSLPASGGYGLSAEAQLHRYALIRNIQEVGNAILKYLQMVRPQCSSRFVFLLLRGPHRPMKPRHASCSISLRVRTLGCHLPHYGPHVLRHACATHLLDEGFSLKEIGDHLGHRSTRSTTIYAKVERTKLGQVADVRLSTLTEYLRTQTQPITADWAKEQLRSLREVSNFGLGGLQ